MEKRYLDTLAAETSLLGMGCMRLPQKNGVIDYPTAEAMVDLCMNAGVNYYDTAYIYHGGESETFLRKALIDRYDRDRFYLADKLPLWLVHTREDAERIFSEQLARTGAGYFDYYLLHGESAKGWEKTKKLDLLRFVWEKKEQGLIQHIGFSFHDTVEVLDKIVHGANWDFAQIQLNYYDWYGELRADELYRILEENGIPCIVMEPVRGGMLANPLPEVARLLDEASPASSYAEMALRFAGSLPGVAVVLSGMSDIAQTAENIEIFSRFQPLNKTEFMALKEASEIIRGIQDIPCTECRYCACCPLEIKIPEIFTAYNSYHKFNHPGGFLWTFEAEIPADKRADACISCGMCEAVCPQHIAIPEEIRRIEEEYRSLSGNAT